jgi:hypothetical protein
MRNLLLMQVGPAAVRLTPTMPPAQRRRLPSGTDAAGGAAPGALIKEALQDIPGGPQYEHRYIDRPDGSMSGSLHHPPQMTPFPANAGSAFRLAHRLHQHGPTGRVCQHLDDVDVKAAARELHRPAEKVGDRGPTYGATRGRRVLRRLRPFGKRICWCSCLRAPWPVGRV